MYKTITATTILILLLISMQTKAQLDTLQYLKQFEINKSQYVNKPFSYLLGQMTQIQPKTVWFYPQTNRKTMVKTSIFNFCEKEKSFNRPIRLYITWKDEIPFQEVKYYHQLNQFYFTNDERQFYGNKIVEDIQVVR